MERFGSLSLGGAARPSRAEEAAVSARAAPGPQTRGLESREDAPGSGIRIHPEVADIPAVLAVIRPPRTSLVHRFVMRSLDIAVSLLVLGLSSPLMLVIAVIIVLDSRGPAVFKQVRVGRDGRLFHFHKFRTMHVDARERFPDLYSYDHSDEELDTLYFKFAEDPRLTRFGAYLRRTSLDELPNFVDVLKGEMTLVGPRPEIPEMIRYYEPEELLKFATKPGVTGLAQISGRNILRFKETIERDLEYVRCRSLRFDLQILSRTPRTVLRMIGAL
jgi:lipopolysaccharide/colanic/teichoic acid biosynthesis glycosyltransferase